ncbi:MAG TPA: hypothetical protein VD769_06840 [Gaiellaceae bacterium]|nr:hypothetical protein [Gaiellaceae bacterium]
MSSSWLAIAAANALLAVLGGIFLYLQGHSVAWVYFGVSWAALVVIGMVALWRFRPAKDAPPN